MTTALSIRNLEKTYPNGFQALKGIDLDVAPGDFFALLGPNGAGKSTIIGIICSLVNKTGGTVSVFGHDIDREFAKAKQHIGVVPQEFNFNQFERVDDILITQAGYYGLPNGLARQRTEKYLKQLGLWEQRAVRGRMLSGGMKRRLMIARALVHEPELLILDEPTAGVDIEIRRSMWSFLRQINAAGTTIILTTHYLEEAETLCRQIAIIDRGIIVENTSVRQLLTKLDRQTFIFDTADELSGASPLDGIDINIIDPHSFEIELRRGDDLNDVFRRASDAGIRIVSMRNKANRLEELFVELTSANHQAP